MLASHRPHRILGAHEIDRDRAYSVLRALGVVLVVWSLGGGVFLICGGAQHLTAPVWQPLVQFTHDYVAFSLIDRADCYLIIGGGLALAGVTGIFGLITEWIWLSLVSCVLDVIWCGYVTVFLALAQTDPRGGNFISVFGILATCMSIARFLTLSKRPIPADALRLHA